VIVFQRQLLLDGRVTQPSRARAAAAGQAAARQEDQAGQEARARSWGLDPQHQVWQIPRGSNRVLVSTLTGPSNIISLLLYLIPEAQCRHIAYFILLHIYVDHKITMVLNHHQASQILKKKVRNVISVRRPFLFTKLFTTLFTHFLPTVPPQAA
jgi:hypothetical protein